MERLRHVLIKVHAYGHTAGKCSKVMLDVGLEALGFYSPNDYVEIESLLWHLIYFYDLTLQLKEEKKTFYMLHLTTV